MDRVVKLLVELKLIAQQDCRAGSDEACLLVEDIEIALRKLEAATA